MKSPQLENPARPWTIIAWILFLLALPTGFLTLLPALICAAVSSSISTRHTNHLIEMGITNPTPSPQNPKPQLAPNERRALAILIPILILFLLACAAAFLFIPR